MPGRSAHNPILRPEDITPSRQDFEVICVLNAAAAKMGDETILLLRVVERPRNEDPHMYMAPIFDPEIGAVTLKTFPIGSRDYNFTDPRGIGTPEGPYLTGLSHLRIARSRDGEHFRVENSPALFPADEYEAFGIEDPRITPIGDEFYISYVAVSRLGIVTKLARTRDFRTFERMGVIFPPDNKDVMLFPQKIRGKYFALHRPSTSSFGKPEIWLAESPDLIDWGHHSRLIGIRKNDWEDGKVGGGAPPFLTPQGWVVIYHAANKANRYVLAAALLDKDDPCRVLARSEHPLLEPEAEYEVKGFYGNVVFTCGVIPEDGKVKVYYGAADTCMALAEVKLDEIFK
jgi:beta-1,2-mannobiose phosphorylase / 1,2-beta-oligomannan phosphorylase